MAIAAAKSLANFAEKRGINPDNILPTMEEAGVFPNEAAEVASQAIADGVARVSMNWDEAYNRAKEDINYSRNLTNLLMESGFIKKPPQSLIDEALEFAIKEVS